MTELISIIVPIYNTEKYLQKCIESVLDQTYKNIELLLINDGSTDGSGRICDAYAKKDKRVSIKHIDNIGVSGARNQGLDLSAGEFICFLDSDDFLAPNMLERLHTLLNGYDADIAMSGYLNVLENGSPKLNIRKPEVGLLSNIQALNKLFEKPPHQAVAACNKLYVKRLFDGIRFPEGKYFEDVYVTYRLYDKAKSVIFTKEPLYFRTIRNTSITGLPYNANRFDAMDGAAERTTYFKDHNMTDLYYKSAYSYFKLMIKSYRRFEKNSDIDKSVLKDLRVRFSRELKHFDILKTLPLRKWLYFILFRINPKLQKYVLAVWVKVKAKKYLNFKVFIKESIKYTVLSVLHIIVKMLRGLRIIKYKKIWLIGGASGRAYTDNSAAFHKYLISTYPEINTYWVANKNCRDINIISNIGPILYKRTIKLLFYLALAEVMIVSHSKSDIYPYHAKMFQNAVKVYLGHGIYAFKQTTRKGKFKTLNEDYNIFIANSDFEKSLINTWDVDSEKVVVTGSPRIDQLFRIHNNNEKSNEKVILYTPTWREWIDNDKNEYEGFKTALAEMVQDKKLNELLCYHGYKINLFLHINMHKYYETIISENNALNFVKLPLNIDLQHYIVLSDMLITDYSSVAWDFLLLNKPVVFYQFDLNQFEYYRRSHIDIRNDLFGPSAYNLSDLTNIIQGHFVNNLIMRDFKGKMAEWKDRMFTYYDQNNCERVAGEIINRLRQN